MVILQELGTSIIKLGFVLVLNFKNSRRLHQAREEMLRGIEEMEVELDAGGNARGMHDFSYALRKFRKDCENFATISKILQSLQNFIMHIFLL